MKDGRTHLAHKAEHAVDLDTGAVLAVTLQGADRADTATLDETLCEAGMAVVEQVGREAELQPHEAPKVNVAGIEETVTDRGYHSGTVVKGMKACGVRSYVPEKKQKGRRNCAGNGEEQQAVYTYRRRVRGEYAKSLLRRRGELLVSRAQLRALLRDGHDAVLPSARTGKHPGPTAGRGHAAGLEEPIRQTCFDPLLTLPVSDES